MIRDAVRDLFKETIGPGQAFRLAFNKENETQNHLEFFNVQFARN